MFLVKSAFWLTVAFIAIHPGTPDVGATATALTNQAMATGQQLIVQQLLKTDCPLAQCAALSVASSSTPSAGLPMQVPAAPSLAPIPRERPAWMS